MKNLLLNDRLLILRGLMSTSLVIWIFATLFYVLCATIFMGSAITECTTTIFGYPSDGSGGISWFQWASHGELIWKFTDMSNFPFGESLNRPQFITAYGLYIPYSILSMMTNQICGLNIMTLLGFVSTALMMFGLIRWLTKSSYIALFAGFSAAFVPFHYMQAQGHLSYVYGSIFIAMIWSFLWFQRQPSVRRILVLAFIYAASLYMDGYFVLLSTALITLLFLFFILNGFVKTKWVQGGLRFNVNFENVLQNIKNNRLVIFVAIATVILLLTPIMYKQIKNGAEIQQDLSSARSSIQLEASTYGTHLSDFLLPSVRSIFVNDGYVNWRVKNIHGSNQHESSLYIGYTIIVLMAFLAGYIFTKRGRKDPLVVEHRSVLSLCLLVIIVLTLISLPPTIELVGVALPTPSALLIEITEKWRVLARFFMITHVAMVAIAAISLSIIVARVSKKWGYVIISILFSIIILEYIPVNNANWSYIRDTPQLYHKIAKDDTVHAIAEYPITDHPSALLPYTFTFQQTHNKPLLNSNGSTTNQHALRQSIAGLADKQTIGVLRQLGIDTVTTLGINANNVSGLITYLPSEKIIDPSIGSVYSYRIVGGVPSGYALVAKDGFSVVLDAQKLKSRQYMINSAILAVESVGKHTDLVSNTSTRHVSFTASAHEDSAQRLVIKQQDIVLWSGIVEKGTRIEFDAHINDAIRLNVSGYYNTPALYLEDMAVEPVNP